MSCSASSAVFAAASDARYCVLAVRDSSSGSIVAFAAAISSRPVRSDIVGLLRAPVAAFAASLGASLIAALAVSTADIAAEKCDSASVTAFFVLLSNSPPPMASAAHASRPHTRARHDHGDQSTAPLLGRLRRRRVPRLSGRCWYVRRVRLLRLGRRVLGSAAGRVGLLCVGRRWRTGGAPAAVGRSLRRSWCPPLRPASRRQRVRGMRPVSVTSGAS